jgi:TolB-like protein
MSDIFVSYARSTAAQAQQIAEALRALGYGVWRDDELPAHRAYAEVIEERLKVAKAVVVIWSAEAAKSQWVRSEADRARTDRKLVQLSVDGTPLPMPFDQIQCADLSGWTGDREASGWRKVVASIDALMGGAPVALAPGTRSERAGISICVLPFANMSGDAEQEYFSDGISEDIITDLSKVSALSVIARNSAFAFKGKHVDLLQVARQLKITHILEGSVRKSGNRVRITAQLIDGSTNDHVWAERYDRNLDDIFALQDEISRAIVTALKLKLFPQEKQAIEERGTSNVEAYDLYLRARSLSSTLTGPESRRSLDVYRRALALDPDFAQAWAGLAGAMGTLFIYYPETIPILRPEMEAANARATELAPDLPEILSSQLMQSLTRYDWASIEQYLAKAAAANDLSGIVGFALVALGRARESVEARLKERQADPLSLSASFGLQFALDIAGRFEEAEAEYERSKDLSGGNRGALEWRAVTRMTARKDTARLKERAADFIRIDSTYMPFLPELLKVLDEPDKALAILRVAFDEPAYQDGARMGAIAHWAVHLGDMDFALKALRRGYVEKRGLTVVEIWHPIFAELRKNPRFKEIVRDIGLADHWRATGNWGDFARPLGDDDFEVFR